MRRFLLVSAGIAVLLASAAVASSGGTQAEARWRITDLGTLGGRESYAAAINAKGQVVGWAETRKGKTHPFLWRSGRMTDLGTSGNPSAWATNINDRGDVIGRVLTVGGDEGDESVERAFVWQRGSMKELWGDYDDFADDPLASEVRAVNEAGYVVGWADDYRDSYPHAFLWRVADARRAKDFTLGIDLGWGEWGEAYDINEQDQVVGERETRFDAKTATYRFHAVLWEHGQLSDLGTLGGKSSSARAINDNGQVAGRSQIVGGRWHAFSWENGEMRDLGTLPGRPHSIAVSVNERGQVIGWSAPRLGDDEELPNRPRAFIWEGGNMRDLGTLGGASSIAYAINDAGQVVGQSQTRNGQWHAFVWQAGKMTALRTLGGTFSAALAINDDGQIVGWSRTRKDVKHAVYWVPTSVSAVGSTVVEER